MSLTDRLTVCEEEAAELADALADVRRRLVPLNGEGEAPVARRLIHDGPHPDGGQLIRAEVESGGVTAVTMATVWDRPALVQAQTLVARLLAGGGPAALMALSALAHGAA